MRKNGNVGGMKCLVRGDPMLGKVMLVERWRATLAENILGLIRERTLEGKPVTVEDVDLVVTGATSEVRDLLDWAMVNENPRTWPDEMNTLVKDYFHQRGVFEKVR